MYLHMYTHAYMTAAAAAFTGHWKANRANRFIVTGARSSDFSKGCSTVFFNMLEQHIEHFENTNPLEKPLDKSHDHVLLPINSLDRLAFQWPEKNTVLFGSRTFCKN